jgi:hypothetical protein
VVSNNIKVICTILDSVVKGGLLTEKGLLLSALGFKVTLGLLEGGSKLSDINLEASLGGLPFLILRLSEGDELVLDLLKKVDQVSEGLASLHVERQEVDHRLAEGVVSILSPI